MGDTEDINIIPQAHLWDTKQLALTVQKDHEKPDEKQTEQRKQFLAWVSLLLRRMPKLHTFRLFLLQSHFKFS